MDTRLEGLEKKRDEEGYMSDDAIYGSRYLFFTKEHYLLSADGKYQCSGLLRKSSHPE